uniref:Beta-ketoacyl-ACP reductase n=1 Tax=Thermosporothrix sp. COM3 TaxID=2490863 RepID=A0A455SHG5_9CHLR|nr:beta-ketoacyl-ACP reductase [Thermosporothrix sp. COM3]
MDLQLQQRTVLVTGSSAGIGRATAIAFGQEGAQVAVTYQKNREGAEQTAASVREAGGKALVVHYDLGDDDSIYQAIRQINEQWGTIDILVHNAADMLAIDGTKTTNDASDPLFETVEPARWRPAIRTGLEGAYLTTQYVLPGMRTQQWGRIVYISSTVVENGIPGMAAYASSKAGLHGLAQTLAHEVGPLNILTNIVMPGVVLTQRTRNSMPEEILGYAVQQVPTRRFAEPEDVASLVVFLASGRNQQINGEVVRVSGGA